MSSPTETMSPHPPTNKPAPRRRIAPVFWDSSLPPHTTEPNPNDTITIHVGISTAKTDKENKDTTTPVPKTFELKRSTVMRSRYFSDYLAFEPAERTISLPSEDPGTVQLYLSFLQTNTVSQQLPFKILAKAYLYGAKIHDSAFATAVLKAFVEKVEKGDPYTGTPVLPGPEAVGLLWEGPFVGKKCVLEVWRRFGGGRVFRGPWPEGFEEELRRVERGGGEGKTWEGVIDPELLDGSGEEEGEVVDIAMDQEEEKAKVSGGKEGLTVEELEEGEIVESPKENDEQGKAMDDEKVEEGKDLDEDMVDVEL